MSEFHFDPDTYMDLMAAEVPLYDVLQDTIALHSSGVVAALVLDLGTGTGETIRRVLAQHPSAQVLGVDESERMLATARERLADRPVDLRVADLLDPLPEGPFDLVVSALAVHHLNGPGKATLFRSVAQRLGPGGRFVLGDVVLPDDRPSVTPFTDDYDKPSSVADQLRWLGEAGLTARVVWRGDDLAVFVADAPA